jgi:hypothetical protein
MVREELRAEKCRKRILVSEKRAKAGSVRKGRRAQGWCERMREELG